MYTKQYFINKFSAIPTEKFIASKQNDGEGGHCAVGWCERDDKSDGLRKAGNSEECRVLEELFHNNGILAPDYVMEEYKRIGHNIAAVNNGENPKYKQATPKERILAALNDCNE